MSTGLDELLRNRLTDITDQTLPPMEDVAQDVLRRVGRRRRWRRVRAGCGVLGLLAVAMGVSAVARGPSSPDVQTDPAETPATTGPLPGPAHPVALERIDAYGGPTGTARIVVHFDAPLPTDEPTYVEDIEQPDALGIVYTTQPPQRIKVCQNTHIFPGEKGTVDVLIPTAWLRPGTRGTDIPVVNHDDPAKVPVCGGPDDTWPLDGYSQIAIWGPESDDPADVRATMSPNGTELVVEIGPAAP